MAPLPEKITASPARVLVGATVAQAAVSFLNFGLPAIEPELRSAYGLSLPAYGAAVTVGALGAAVSLLFAGVLVDRIGSRPTMLAGTGLAVASLVAASLSDSSAVLVVTLFVAGVGTSVTPIAGLGAVFRVYAASRRAWALSVRQMAVPLGGTTAALVLPPLADGGGVDLVLLVSAALIGTTGFAFAAMADTGAARVRGARLAVGRVLRAPGIPRLLVVAALYILVLQSVLVYIVPTARAAGLSELAASAAYVVLNAAAAAGRIVWGRIADRGGGGRRVRTLVDIGWMTAIIGVLFAGALHVGTAAVIAGAVLYGFIGFGWNALVYVSAGERLPAQLAGQAVAIASTVVFAVGAIGTPAAGALAEAAGWDVLWLTTAGIAALGALVSASVPERRR
jgi:MFS family permease